MMPPPTMRTSGFVVPGEVIASQQAIQPVSGSGRQRAPMAMKPMAADTSRIGGSATWAMRLEFLWPFSSRGASRESSVALLRRSPSNLILRRQPCEAPTGLCTETVGAVKANATNVNNPCIQVRVIRFNEKLAVRRPATILPHRCPCPLFGTLRAADFHVCPGVASGLVRTPDHPEPCPRRYRDRTTGDTLLEIRGIVGHAQHRVVRLPHSKRFGSVQPSWSEAAVKRKDRCPGTGPGPSATTAPVLPVAPAQYLD